jgi:hypothetical protein
MLKTDAIDSVSTLTLQRSPEFAEPYYCHPWGFHPLAAAVLAAIQHAPVKYTFQPFKASSGSARASTHEAIQENSAQLFPTSDFR